jgi:hypothetical protein
MAQADDTPTRWTLLAKVFARYGKIYGEAVAKRDLPARLGSGKVSWRGEKRGQGPLDVGDPRAFRHGDSTDALLGISWAEGRVIRGTTPQRIIVRTGERVYRPALRRYEFVRAEVALDELIALMPEDVRAKMEPRGKAIWQAVRERLTPVKVAQPAQKPRPKLDQAEKWLRKVYPEHSPTSIPETVSVGEAQRRIDKAAKGLRIATSTLKRAMGRSK